MNLLITEGVLFVFSNSICNVNIVDLAGKRTSLNKYDYRNYNLFNYIPKIRDILFIKDILSKLL
ncbi:MAG: hypothetical protein A2Y10_08355 [Planctomycetes bacterium GWF2_41_51]|nr:MAG: hypothetical protein A2Y10_08355 [Planctomycetes bacterium GWF2_41_51]HBG25838.1 hypothetical protein [Phycisphaerales bacterium]